MTREEGDRKIKRKERWRVVKIIRVIKSALLMSHEPPYRIWGQDVRRVSVGAPTQNRAVEHRHLKTKLDVHFIILRVMKEFTIM